VKEEVIEPKVEPKLETEVRGEEPKSLFEFE
jgi:hypothetical protein